MEQHERIPTEEHLRLAEDAGVSPTWPSNAPWRRWGPYLGERAWGTVREDYSYDGNAWAYLSHDQARSKAYRWGDDGIGGICDRYQILCFALALWNGRDPILKERLFGLTPLEGNHGEDVKEYYFYLDATPTASYLRFLYKYPQARFPYEQLVDENRRRGAESPEFELLETGVFAEDRYFDVVIEYAKATTEDIAIRIEVFNRGPEAADLHLVPQLWFRNTWAWSASPHPTPIIRPGPDTPGCLTLIADDSRAHAPSNLVFEYHLGPRYFVGEADGVALFADNESNAERLYGSAARSRSRFPKDAFHRYIVDGEADAVNPEREGTKAGVHFRRTVPAGGSIVLRLRLADRLPSDPLGEVDDLVARRRAEADCFYAEIQPAAASVDERAIQRQAFAGMIWSKQVYLFDVTLWIDGDDPSAPPPPSRRAIRNRHWRHLNSMRVLSMPDKWEYPWFAAWDLAFHTVTLALIDPAFAKEQLWVMLFEQFQHKNGQIPAYEWEFSDLNPPVHAWAVWRVYNMDRIRSGVADRAFLERCFHKLLINFTWWVNKVDSSGNNVFEGGFLGLDNITVVDRSQPLPDGARLEQADATGWMGMYCQNLLRIALELSKENPVYEGLAVKFFEHYVYVGAAMKRMGGRNHQLWDDKDGFFYDVLTYPDGRFETFRVRSLVGLIPLYAVERLELEWLKPFPVFRENLIWFLANRRHITGECVTTVERADGRVHVLMIVDQAQLRRMLARIWSPDEFLGPYGLRSLSRVHLENPFVFGPHVVRYEPGEAVSKLKGGNSNWRGPVWFPMTFLMIESLRKLGRAYGEHFDTGIVDDEGEPVTVAQIAGELANRAIAIFTRGPDGLRPAFPPDSPFQRDPHWRDLLLFHEYFHGDTGLGLGASHQTGWTGLIASLIDEWRR